MKNNFIFQNKNISEEKHYFSRFLNLSDIWLNKMIDFSFLLCLICCDITYLVVSGKLYCTLMRGSVWKKLITS